MSRHYILLWHRSLISPAAVVCCLQGQSSQTPLYCTTTPCVKALGRLVHANLNLQASFLSDPSGAPCLYSPHAYSYRCDEFDSTRLDSMDMLKALREQNGKYLGNRPMKISKSSWKDRDVKEVRPGVK